MSNWCGGRAIFHFTRPASHSAWISAALVAVVCVVCVRPAVAGQKASDDEAAVRGLIARFYHAYAREDLEGIKSAWSTKVPGIDRLLAALELTIKGRNYTFENIAVSRVDVKSITATARVTLDATIVETASSNVARQRWVRNFALVKEPEGWRVWRDASAAEDTALEIRGAASAAEAADIVEREPELMVGEVSQALFGLGNRLRTFNRPAEADEAYRLSALVAERSGDPAVLGRSHGNLGVNEQFAARYDRALEQFEKALALFEKAGDRASIAGAESNIGSALYLLNRYPEAIERYQRALAFYERNDEQAKAAGMLHSIGNAQYLTNDFDAALVSYRRGLALLESTGDTIGAANVLQAIGLVQQEQGDYDAALESYSASLVRHEKGGNDAGRGVVLASLADVHRLAGDSSRALDRYFGAIPLLEKMGDRETLGSAIGDIAGVYAAERRYPQALEFYARSLAVVEKAGNKATIARVVAGAGAVYFAQGKYPQAMEQYERSLGLFREASSNAGIAWTLVHMGLVHQAERRFAEAQAAYEQGLAIVEGLKDESSVAVTLALLARTRAALDRPHEALALARRAAAVAGEIGELDTVARAHLVAGETWVQLEYTKQARKAFADAVTALEQLQMEGAGAERDRFFGDTLAPFLGLVRLAALEGRGQDGLSWLERGKAYLLRNVIGGTGALITTGMTDAERDRERALGRRLVSLATQVRRERGRKATDQARFERLRTELEKTRNEKAAFTTALYETHPALKALRVQGEPVALGEKSNLALPISSAVVEFAVSEQRTFAFIVAGRTSPAPTVVVRAIDVRAADLAAKVAQFRSLVAEKDPGADVLARELYDLLIKPAEGDLAGATSLVIVPDAVTWALPFQALQTRAGRYLVEDRAIAYAPSLASLADMLRPRQRTASAAAPGPTAASFGLASVGEAASQRLAHLRPDVKMDATPEAPGEAAAVARLYGPSRAKAFVGDAASKAQFRNEGASRNVLHVASPGILNDSSPLASQIAMTPAGPDGTDDGLLETWELMGLELNADVAFFSRLQGEAGQSRAGEAAVALAWAAFVAGTPSTVISAWVVDAPSTTALALAFHRRLAAGAPAFGASRSPTAEALRRAALVLLAAPSTRHPYYWAGFSAFGR